VAPLERNKHEVCVLLVYAQISGNIVHVLFICTKLRIFCVCRKSIILDNSFAVLVEVGFIALNSGLLTIYIKRSQFTTEIYP